MKEANQNNDGVEKRHATIRTRINTTQLTLATKPTATKSFLTFEGMTDWLNNPMNQRLYKVGRIDWVEYRVQVEGKKPVVVVKPWYEQCREMGWTLD
jgi:hypothetical protein